MSGPDALKAWVKINKYRAEDSSTHLSSEAGYHSVAGKALLSVVAAILLEISPFIWENIIQYLRLC